MGRRNTTYSNFGDNGIHQGDVHNYTYNRIARSLADLRLTDPRIDKTRIQQTKGALFKDSYRWVLENETFKNWRNNDNNERSQVLWIKGDSGKGKTMLLCGIIDELFPETKLANPTIDTSLSYFFCQGTDSRMNNETAILRGLIYLLIVQQPSLLRDVEKEYNRAGDRLLVDANVWEDLSKIFDRIISHLKSENVILIIDALDECAIDLSKSKLLDLIVQSSTLSCIKWVISSRNIPSIQQKLMPHILQRTLSLESQENAGAISRAVDAYIERSVSRLRSVQDDNNLQRELQEAIRQKASGNFLWASIVIRELGEVDPWEVMGAVEDIPTDLTAVYKQMIGMVKKLKRRNPEYCQKILSTVFTAYRPLSLKELGFLSDLPTQVLEHAEDVRKMVAMCGSFLTVHESSVYFIHQTAKDFLHSHAFEFIFPSGLEEIHYSIFLRSLEIMSKTLKRDIYDLSAVGYHIDQFKQPDPDPLSTAEYSCIYCIEHLCDSNPIGTAKDALQEGGPIDMFLRHRFLYWLEALSLLRSMLEGIRTIEKLKLLVKQMPHSQLLSLVYDARQFISRNRRLIESTPLQVYVSALIFGPVKSKIREIFKHEEPPWIVINSAAEAGRGGRLQNSESHNEPVTSVVFSSDGQRIASCSHDKTVKVWDTNSGACLHTFQSHGDWVQSVVFSSDGQRLASISADDTVKVWDANSGACLHTFQSHGDRLESVIFSPDGQRLASISADNTVEVWDANLGICLQTLGGNVDSVDLVIISSDGQRLASISYDYTIKIWDTNSGACLQTLQGHNNSLKSVVFSPDCQQLASGSRDRTIRVWDANSGACLQTLMGHNDSVTSVLFSPDGQRIASCSRDKTVKVWNTSSGACLQTLESHNDSVKSLVFSLDGQRLASISYDYKVKAWDMDSGACLQTLEGHFDSVNSLVFSSDGQRIASCSHDKTFKLWDANSGARLHTFQSHGDWVQSVVFSTDGQRIASYSRDKTVRVWDTNLGTCLHSLKGHGHWIDSIIFSPDGQRLASSSAENTVKVWDTSSGACLQTLKGHCDSVNSVVFLPDGQRIASTSDDSSVRLWDTNSLTCLQTLGGHRGSVKSTVFANNGQQFASILDDNTVKVWDTDSGSCLQTLKGHYDSVNLVVFSSDGQRIASTSDDIISIYDTFYLMQQTSHI
ncbi:Pfs, NACHT and WD domain protein [Trichoderma velutinum]